MSERANELAKRSARVKRAVRSKRMSEQCVRTSKRTSKWPSNNVLISRDSVSLCSGCSESGWLAECSQMLRALNGLLRSHSGFSENTQADSSCILQDFVPIGSPWGCCPAYKTATIMKYQCRAKVPWTIYRLWVTGCQ